MIVARLAVGVLLVAAFFPPSPAGAIDPDVDDPVVVGTTEGGLFVDVLHEQPGTEASEAPEAESRADGVVSVVGDVGTELIDQFCTGVNWTGSCLPISAEDEEPVPSQITPGLVATAFQELPLPASKLVVQPPGGRTLVNFATNFYTVREPFTEVVTLLGQRVELQIRAAGFRWVYGDGVVEETVGPGAPYPDLAVTHAYLRRGRVSPQVDTTYAAEFRVNDGPWRPVVGTVTVPGEPVGLRVDTATPVLVGYE